MSLVVESILYTRITYSDWSAIHGERETDTGTGGQHISLDSIREDNPTFRFFGDLDPEENNSFSAKPVGVATSPADITVTNWTDSRNQWIIADQKRNRHPALGLENNMPGYEDSRFWDGGGYESGNWLHNMIVYIAKCSDGELYLGYIVSESLPGEWPSARVKDKSEVKDGEGGRIGYIELSEPMNLTEVAGEVLRSFGKRKNVLIYGSPGTGKTLALTQLLEAFKNPNRLEWLSLDPSNQGDPFSKKSAGSLPMEEPVYSDWITFHQRTTYEEFVVGLRPKPSGGGVHLEPRAGRLLEAIRAVELGVYEAAVLFIDEINRGNTAAVLGEFITFLEPVFKVVEEGAIV